MNNQKKRLANIPRWIILGLIVFMPLFGHLSKLPIRLWDESRLAVNASEMAHNHNYLVTSYNGSPDMWNTKPPLLIWLQVGFIKLLGLNELSIRLPSALAALCTCLLLVFVSHRYLKKFSLGMIAVLVLITAGGYVSLHGVRTGDYDALLTFFTTASCLCLFIFTEQKKVKYLYAFFACIALGVLTKSVAGLLFIPGLFIYLLVTGHFLSIIRIRHFYFGALAAILIILSYYGLRELYNPGYMDAVRANELGGRFMETIENHHHGFWYYFENLKTSRFSNWLVFIPCGALLGVFSSNLKIKRLTLFSIIMLVSYFLIISSAQAKLSWYDLPMYPFMAILVAVFFGIIYDVLNAQNWTRDMTRVNLIPIIFLFLLFLNPFREILAKTYLPEEENKVNNDYFMSYYLRDAAKGKYDVDGQKILYDNYKAQVRFYQEMLLDRGQDVNFGDYKNLSAGDTVIVVHSNVKQFITKNYEYEVVGSKVPVVTYAIK